MLEFDHESILPPPLNLLEPFLNCSGNTARHEDDSHLHGNERLDVSVTRRDLKDAQQRAFLAITYEEDTGESAMLRAELAELRRRNQDLAQRNKDLETLAANYLLEQSRANGAVQVASETPFNAPASPNVAAAGAGLVRRTRRLTTTPLSAPVVVNNDG